MKSEKFWNSAAIIGVITAYLYSISVLIQYGQNLFFNTHQSLIETSIRENIVWFFILSKIIKEIIILIPLWQWFVLIPLIVIVIVLFVLPKGLGRKISLIVAVVLAIYSLYIWSSFGYRVAQNRTNHLVLSSGCYFVDEDEYIVTSIYEGKVVLVPIDRKTNKMKNKFFVKNLSDLTCGMEYKEIGKINK